MPRHRARQQFLEFGGADHRCFIDDDQSAPVHLEPVVFDELQRFCDRQSAVAGFVAHRFVDGLAGGREHQDLFVCAVCGGAQRFEGVRLARAGWRL